MSRNKEYQFVPTDVGTIEDDMTARLEELTGQKVRQGSPEGQMLHWMAQIISQERVMTNYAANQNIPSRRRGRTWTPWGSCFSERPDRRPRLRYARCGFSSRRHKSFLLPFRRGRG